MPIFICENFITTRNNQKITKCGRRSLTLCERSPHRPVQMPRRPFMGPALPPPQVTATWLLWPRPPRVASKFVFMSFTALLCYTFPVQPFPPFSFIRWRIQSIWPVGFYRETASVFSTNWKPDPRVWSDSHLIPFAKLLCFYQETCNVWLSCFVMSAAIEERCLDPLFHLRWLDSGILSLSHWLAGVPGNSCESTIWLLSGREFLYEREDKCLILSLYSLVFKINVSITFQMSF